MKAMFGLFLNQDVFDIVKEAQQTVKDRLMLEPPNLSPHITLTVPIQIESEEDPKFLGMQRVALKMQEIQKPVETRITGYSTFRDRVVFANVEKNEALNNLFSVFNEQLELQGVKLKPTEKDRHPHITIVKEYPSGVSGKDIIELLSVRSDDRISRGFPIKLSHLVIYTKEEKWDTQHVFRFDK